MKRKARSHHDAHLAPDDRVLWHRVTRTVTPLSRSARQAEDDEMWQDWLAEAFPGHERPSAGTGLPQRADLSADIGSGDGAPPVMHPARPAGPGPHRRPPAPGAIENPVWKKIARGRTPIDASIDLHHLNQDEAFHRLHAFLVQARARGCRHVLVITGKGSAPGSDGILRRMLPVWVSTTPFTHLVGALRPAGRGHGGDGAFYVRLRKADERRPSTGKGGRP